MPVKSGSTVRLTLSKGAEPVLVPDLSGMSEQAASVMLSNFGLILSEEVERVNDTDYPAGQIIGQDPAPETQVQTGATVTIVVSKGPQQIPVQSFVGMTISAAEGAAEGLGIALEASYEMNWNYAKDIIVRQDPAGGSGAMMDANSPIKVVVSLGPGPTVGGSGTGGTGSENGGEGGAGSDAGSGNGNGGAIDEDPIPG